MLLIKAQPYHGYHPVVQSSNGTLKLLTLALLKLNPGETYQGDTEGNEQVFVLLQGQFDLSVGTHTFGGQRTDVFSDRATAVYLPPHATYEVRNNGSNTMEAAIAGTPAEGAFAPFLVKPGEVQVRRVGQGNWARTVQDIVVGNVTDSVSRIVVGETINDAGNWSGYPPHKHDDYIPGVEADMEELYHFRVAPPQGFATQLHYRKDPAESSAYVVHDGDTFMIPHGYHPVVAAAGYQLYYLWMMAGEQDRVLMPHEDPDHVWVKQV
ncbi:MAG: 5-deoxy-glucuronate isomerase [Sulfobacillus acidophilus]|uniref:5-deoxy-glucuronate isomerase n=1 Tax=Sulfobacillus acidophilus TaxID=53633 RepID=A0A2T2WCK0_9FIRM|nr:MAG: 5-deoxy-glucuronate isomerase [Sulfobacillus acidophilus]